MKRQFNIIRRSEDYGSPLRRRFCVDIDKKNSTEIRNFLEDNRDEFLIIVERLLTIPNILYDRYKQEYKNGTRPVTAIRFFDSQNTRIYCQEMTNDNGQFFIICVKLFGKKSQKNNKTNQPILKSIAEYEYSHKP